MNSRLLAAKVLSRVLSEGQSLTAVLEQLPVSSESDRDQAFIRALCYGVVRWFYRLDFILNRLLSKPLKNPLLKALALIGLYQLLYTRVKMHAAVSETVAAVPKKMAWAKPLLNAVLRNFQRRRAEWVAEADRETIAATAHPMWLIRQLGQDWPEQAQRILRENNTQAPMVLRVNLSRCSRSDYQQQLADLDLAATAVADCSSALVLQRPVPVTRLPGFAEGWVSVQDTAAQLAATLLQLEVGQRVLDMCAAPGGKTAHILESQPRLAKLVAVDIDESRMRRVEENLRRLQLHADLVVADGAKPDVWWDGTGFDRILLDAPCSATGVIRRHPDIKLLRRPDDIAQLQTLQRRLLDAMWPLLASGGVMLYATCSLFKQENEKQLERFLNDYENASEWPLAADWGEARTVGRQILTGDNGMDGFYYARIVKR